jgi:hypothetical protein
MRSCQWLDILVSLVQPRRCRSPSRDRVNAKFIEYMIDLLRAGPIGDLRERVDPDTGDDRALRIERENHSSFS